MDEPLEYPFFDTLHEVTNEARDQLNMARSTDDVKRIVIRLRMAHRAIECALEVCGDYAAMKEKK